jgi:NADH:ubiquinone oxidoreductase subunit 6 (subunit J)
MLGLGGLSFYKATTYNYIEKFNINYERIKMFILLFCLITFVITFYNIDPGGAAQKYFGYSLLLTIIISVFAFLYVIILLTLSNEAGSKQENILNNFSSFGTYGTLLFFIFLVVITIIISNNKESFFANKEKSCAVIILLLIICITWSLLLGANLFGNDFNNITDSSKMNLFKKSLLVLFGLVISGMLIFWISYNIENLSGKSSIVSYILNLLLVTVILGLIYKTIYVKIPVGNIKKNAFFNLIISTLFYIPCLLSDMFDLLGKLVIGQYNSTNAGSFIMILVIFGLIVAYFKTPSLFNFISTQGGKQLVNRPVYTDTTYNLGGYQDLTGSDKFDYQYAISCWIYIDSAGPNMNPNYNKYTSLLNFGNKPNVLYNGKKHSLMITIQQQNLQDVTKNKLIDFDSEGNRIIYINDNILLQKWNNLIINYNGGTLDIFLNGELVKSSIEVIPYYKFDNLTIGENDGIKGGICNVVYFRSALTYQNIYYIYNTLKNRVPPVLNDSNETILVKNIIQTVNSAENVIK